MKEEKNYFILRTFQCNDFNGKNTLNLTEKFYFEKSITNTKKNLGRN